MRAKEGLQIVTVLLTVMFTALSLTSCQKEVTLDLVSSDSTSIPTNTTTSKVKTYSEYVATGAAQPALFDSFTLSYDSKDRLTSLISILNPGKFVYTYNTNNTYIMDLYVGNALSIHELFFLNSFSLVDSTIQTTGTSDTTTEKYTYNSNKQLTTLKEYFYSVLSPDITIYNYTYDNNGNVLTETSSKTSSTTTYDYYLDKPNDVAVGEVYFYRNKNLTKTTTTTSGGTATAAHHTYTFDNSNRQISEKIVADNGDTVIRKYTYY